MKNIILYPRERARGVLALPGDKSISHRAALLAGLCPQQTRIRNFLFADDCRVTLDALEAMGVRVAALKEKREVSIRGQSEWKTSRRVLDMKESGTSCRLLLGLLAAQGVSVRITGAPSLARRPMRRVLEPLRLMGAEIAARKKGGEEFLPFVVRPSSLSGIDWTQEIPSAQVKSAVLLAGLFAQGPTRVREPIASRDHTERMLEAFGADISVASRIIAIRQSSLKSPGTIDVPADISSAAFFLVLGSLVPGSDILLKGVGVNPSRAGILRVLRRMGARITLLNRKDMFEPAADIRVRSSLLKGVRIEAAEIPSLVDELPVLMVAAARAIGKTVIKGVQELRVKETDRIRSMTTNLAKLGVIIKVRAQKKTEDLEIQGVEGFRPARLQSFGDHRTAMSAMVASCATSGPCVLDDISCISKSFPEFPDSLSHLFD